MKQHPWILRDTGSKVIFSVENFRLFFRYLRKASKIEFLAKNQTTREKKTLEQLSRPLFLPGFEISRSFLRAKQVERRAGNFKNPEKFVVLKVVLISFCL